jgi:hypothetical protein
MIYLHLLKKAEPYLNQIMGDRVWLSRRLQNTLQRNDSKALHQTITENKKRTSGAVEKLSSRRSHSDASSCLQDVGKRATQDAKAALAAVLA